MSEEKRVLDPALEPVSHDELNDGSYFLEARRWYDTLYIRPIHERIYFILCAFIALITAFAGLIAVDGITPLENTKPFVFSNREYNTIPLTERIRSVGENMNTVLKRFFLSQFVKYHEGYSENKYISNQRYIRNYGTKDIYRNYKREIDPKNPRSPLVLYQKNFDRKIYIDQITLYPGESPLKAKIDFTADVVGQDRRISQTYTANLTYTYQPWDEGAKEIVDPETGDVNLNLDAIEFKVIDYDVRSRVQ